MSNNVLQESPEPEDPNLGPEGTALELTQWNASAIDAEAEPEKYRSRLRIIAVLAGLNVSPTPELQFIFRECLTSPAGNVHHSPRPNHRCYCRTHDNFRAPFSFWLCLDWRCLYARERSRRAHLGKALRYCKDIRFIEIAPPDLNDFFCAPFTSELPPNCVSYPACS